MACTPAYVELTEKLLLLRNEIAEEQKHFDQFWSKHKTLLDRVMNFTLFDRSVNKVWIPYSLSVCKYICPKVDDIVLVVLNKNITGRNIYVYFCIWVVII